MSENEKVQLLVAMMDEKDEDINHLVLQAYLRMAKQKILNRMYPYKTDYTGMEVPERYDMTQINIAIYLLNKRGAEGQIQHIENGIHRNYGSADVPEGMLQDVVPFCQAIR